VTYAEAVQFLYGLRLFGAKFGLENTFKLAALAGNPQDRLRFIHVAGTNGKGSTCAMLESIYRASGLRVGLFTSPHLRSFRERIQINRQWVAEMEVVRLVEELQPWLKQFPAGHHPTFFEAVTVMALRFFAEQKCDLVIWETGLGGRLDATNIVRPLASVITNIALDHEQWLGDTIEKIAAEKAGIIKPETPVVTSADDPGALAVIEKTAREKNARMFKIEQASRFFGAGETPALPLLGDHQRLNAALALATVQALQGKIPVNGVTIRAGLETVNWPGRLQLVTRTSGQKILLDGAHNAAGALALAGALEKHFGGRERTLILGVLQDKDWRQICDTLAPLASKIYTVPVASDRTADKEELAMACRRANASAKVLACDSVAAAMGKASPDDFVAVAGSLYLVGEALELLGLSPSGRDERALNDWSAPVRPEGISI